MENEQPVSIAVVDDHAMLRQAIAFRLNLLGFKVILEAENGKEFLDKLFRLQIPPDVCLLDINMPQMDGFDTALALKKLWPGIKILFFSMHNSKSYISKAQQVGADGFLSKDASFDELNQALKELTNK